MFAELFFLHKPDARSALYEYPKRPRMRAFTRCIVNIALASLLVFSVFGSLFCSFNVVFN